MVSLEMGVGYLCFNRAYLSDIFFLIRNLQSIFSVGGGTGCKGCYFLVSGGSYHDEEVDACLRVSYKGLLSIYDRPFSRLGSGSLFQL